MKTNFLIDIYKKSYDQIELYLFGACFLIYIYFFGTINNIFSFSKIGEIKFDIFL